jgi:RNA polymerase sigma-70 factor (ECF subfamily)
MDERLLQMALKGDKEAFKALFERHKDRVYATALRIVGNRDDAAEILQEVFLKVYRKGGSFRAKSSVGTWIMSIAIHASLNRAKRAKIIKFVPMSEPPPSHSPASMNGQLSHALLQLEPGARAVLALRYFEEMDYAQIADALGCAIGTVKSRLHYAHMKLREVLKGELHTSTGS